VRIPFLPPKWAQDDLWTKARKVPSLDLRFAENKSLVDATTGSNLVTFTRASSGTFVGSDGVIRSAVTNLLLRSEEFNFGWSLIGASISADAAASPIGTTTADTLKEDSTSGLHEIFAGSSPAGNTYTLSIFVKNFSGSRYLNLSGSAGSGNYVSVRFSPSVNDLSSTTVAGNFSNATASAAIIGDGWFRVRLTFTLAGATNVATQIGLSTASNPTLGSFGLESYIGDNTSGLFIWGAQLEQSSTVGEYIPTTSTINSAPRFDHNPTTGESLGLLVEEQRTNLLVRSEEFDNASWVKTRASVTANAASAPTGNVTADKFVEDNTASATHRIDSGAISVGSGATTFSLYAKAAERGRLTISFDGSPGGVASSAGCVFDLSTGAVGSPSATGNISNATASIVNAGDGWYRVILTASASAAFTATCRINLMDATSASYTGDGTSGLFLWGAQLEAGAFPTSYIPTTTATVTRSADVASIGSSAFSSWYRADAGTVFSDWSTSSSSEQIAWTISNGTLDESLRASTLVAVVSNNTRLVVLDNNSLQAGLAVGVYTPGSRRKTSLAYQQDNFAGAADGAAVVTDTSGTLPTVDRLFIGANWSGAGGFLGGTIRRLTYWNQRLPNSTLQAVTQ